ncbi:MAG: hypothetical protein A2287_09265 [Candidatus Melainabacteria bacterium RIFOXYA12_FULL_32_12]|nr:MAG: hypothetical protein A2287_09265 [Candidatus Melainabacteria bacterium RIFOXYA12_FULL_32_12]
MPVRERIKSLLAQENLTIKQLAELLSERTGRPYSLQSISHRMLRGTLSFNEAEIIAEILGYDIKFEKFQS